MFFVIYFYRKAEGYQEGDYTQHAKMTVTEFIDDPKFLDKLALASEVRYSKLTYYSCSG